MERVNMELSNVFGDKMMRDFGFIRREVYWVYYGGIKYFIW